MKRAACTGWIAEVCKLNVVAQKRFGWPRKSWDEVLENDRKKLGMDSADPQNCRSGEDAFEKDLSKSLGRGKPGSKMDMMMITIYGHGSHLGHVTNII